MPDVTLTVTLTLNGPILTQSTAAGAYGIDSPVARNADKKCYLAGTLVKGRLRQAWEELLPALGPGFDQKMNDWLGQKTGNAEPDGKDKPIAPSRGRLHFEDFVDDVERRSGTLYRISLDDQLGAVRKGAYQVIEAPYAAGQEISFSGKIRYFVATEPEATEIKRCVEVGLRWITSLGAERTVGFGRMVKVEVSEDPNPPQAPETAVTGALMLDFALTPETPFCIARRRVNNNLFESEEVIPGGVLKGSIASSWRARLGQQGDGAITPGMDTARPELCRHFEKLRITHAFPASAAQPVRPVVAPLSQVKFKIKDQPEVRDIALCDGPMLLGNPPVAPSFAVDWKDDDDVRHDFGWPDLEHELRVRTAIDRDLRKAKEEQLFAYEMIAPRGRIEWYGLIDLSQVPEAERAAVEAQLRDLLSQGLHGLGKTKARARIVWLTPGTVAPKRQSQAAPINGQWVVVLQTPALLCDPSRLNEASGDEELCKAYNEVWDQLSNHSLQVVRFFARQSLAGGYYLHRRFQAGKAYNPYLLTDAGSAFVLKGKNGQTPLAQQSIDDWLAYGLPLPSWAVKHYKRNDQRGTLLLGDHWMNCPYLPANGYGEIVVNLDVHTNRQPQKGEFHVI
ncbi:MAG: RAMP superfamily CRISPR-associated protein [Acidobacteriota bacterium]